MVAGWSLALGGGQRGQEHGRQETNNRDDDQQHDEGKTTVLGVHARIIAHSFFHYKLL